MNTPMRRRQRGTTLLEGLVALLVLSLGMFSVARVQTQLRLNADTARQRSEAVRLAQEDLERLRAFSVVAATAGARAFADIVDATTTVDASTGLASNTLYRITRSVTEAQVPQARNASVMVSWEDRSGTDHRVVLDAVIAGSNPAYSGALHVAPAVSNPASVNGRSVHIPRVARNLGDGTSAFKPVGNGTVALIMDNTTGQVMARCTGVNAAVTTASLTAADLVGCDATPGLLLSGVVRFSTSGPPVAGQAHDVPQDLTVAVNLTGGSYPAPPQCTSEAMKTVAIGSASGTPLQAVPITATPAALGLGAWTETGDHHVAYHCVIHPLAGSGVWSGRVTIVPVGWTLGTGPDDRRVCRYSADLDGSGAVDANAEHPASYSAVDGPLAHQNLLVIQGDQTCPAGSPVRLAGEGARIFADLSTVQHQP